MNKYEKALKKAKKYKKAYRKSLKETQELSRLYEEILEELKDVQKALHKAKKKGDKQKRKYKAVKAALKENLKANAAPKEIVEAPAKSVEKKDFSLTAINGIGPKIAGILQQAQVVSIASLATQTQESLKGILEAAGLKSKIYLVENWIGQAIQLAEQEGKK
ncbi:MAG: WS/DGAT domain-containing protein [Bacteroidota bacterium]